MPDQNFASDTLEARATLASHTSPSRGPPARVLRMAMAHGILASLAWAFIFPLGGILIRLCSFRKLLWAHALLQIFGLCVYTVAVGLGIRLGISPRHWWIKDKHAIIGLTVYGLFLFQTASGYIHHLLFKKFLSRTTWSHIHLWTGRLCITLGMVNAGFGFQLRKQGTVSWKVKTFTVCAVLMWVAYVASAVFGEYRKKRHAEPASSALGVRSSIATSDNLTQVITEIPKEGK